MAPNEYHFKTGEHLFFPPPSPALGVVSAKTKTTLNDQILRI